MVQTEYALDPLGRNLMIGVLIFLFVLFFGLVPLFLIPVNWVIALFIDFRIPATIFVRGAGAVFFSILIVAIIVERLYAYISWYRFDFDGERTFTIEYRNSLLEKYQTKSFNLRETKISYLDHLMWVVSFEEEERLSLLIRPPDELEGEEFYNEFDEAVDENYYKVKKKLERIGFEEFPYHFIFESGKIKKFNPRDFELLTGLNRFYQEESEQKKSHKSEKIEYIKEEEKQIEQLTDLTEIEQIMENAEIVKTI